MAEILNDTHPNELFKFIQVRGANKNDDDNRSFYFVDNIYDKITPTELSSIQGNISTLYPQLLSLIGNPNQLQEQLNAVSAYKSTTQFIENPDNFPNEFPELAKFISWLDAHISVAEFNEIKTKFESVFGQTIQDYFSSLTPKSIQCVLWDNLLANLFSADNAFLITLSCKYLDGLHIAQIIAENDANTLRKYASKIVSIYHAKPLVPKWLFDLFAQIDSNPDEGVGDQNPITNVDTLQRTYDELTKAVKEIRHYVLKKEDSLRFQVSEFMHNTDLVIRPISAQDLKDHTSDFDLIYDKLKSLQNPYEIKSDDLDIFSRPTRTLITNLLGDAPSISVELLIQSLSDDINQIQFKLGEGKREYSAKVGDSIISKKDLCADIVDRDPCAVLPRKDFYSKGSFINSALIGDLLITKQQLVKYNTGEVAHVENAMQGLEKERIFRRLNRTETTTSITRESSNETERETQTTERFSMEKETHNAIQQNFQIDAGVNTTASYGVANISASLDASYGYSQQQAQASATSFTREVSDKALTRVKELVRETQTITVLNEIEETSTHKLTNDTGDNLNGTYCWLDKYYLNKIHNYGRRLMFEFTVPEPANFFIFRNLAKPKTGVIIEKPEIPSQVIGPDGNALTSPAVLNDTNYAFWASKYDVANIDAPPQQYISVSKSWKNEYPTLQSGDQYDSFASEIAVPADYEAISANVYAENYWWGSYNIHGSVGTTYFGKGTYNNLPLNKLRNTVAVAMLSQGMNFRLNIVVKAERSEEIYNRWKTDFYNNIIAAYNEKKRAYDEWIVSQNIDTAFGFVADGNNPGINRQIEQEELKKRCLEMFTGQRFESFDAATNGILNVSGYPEILFNEAIREGNLVKFFEQAFEWENITYIFYPYFWGRKANWLSVKNLESVSDPKFTKFLQAGYARVQIPARPGFENFLLMFNLLSKAVSSLGCAWNFSPGIFGALGISNEFSPGINDPMYMSVTEELIEAEGWSINEPNPDLIGHFVQKVPTNLVYIVPNSLTPGDPLPGLPDNSDDPDVQPYL